jgi:hypothetical protein
MDVSEYRSNFYTPIMNGDLDEYLDALDAAIRERKHSMAPKIWEFQVGDRVRLKNANPKYLNGQTATVKKINRTKVVIDLDNPSGRFYTNITTPLGMLEMV